MRIKKVFKSETLSACLLELYALAEDSSDFIFDTKSLVGIEGGCTVVNLERYDQEPITPPSKNYENGKVSVRYIASSASDDQQNIYTFDYLTTGYVSLIKYDMGSYALYNS